MSHNDGVHRLSLALHSAVPPFLTVCIVYSVVIDKAFVLFKVMGEAFHWRIKGLFSRVYIALNILLGLGIGWFLCENCSLWNELLSPRSVARVRFESHEMCLPSMSASCIMALLLMWIDRAAALFFAHAPGPSSSIFVRSSTAAAVAGAFIASSQNDPTGVFLLILFYTGRTVGTWPTDQSRNFASGLRFAVRIYSLFTGLLLLWDMRECEADSRCRATPTTAALTVALSIACF